MNLDDRERRLLAFIEDYRDRECRVLLDRARAQASEKIAATYRSERAQLHYRIAAERDRANGLIRAARAEQATRMRAAKAQTLNRLIDEYWPRLRARLLEHWGERSTRLAWTAHYMQQAARLFPRQGWMISHAPEWSADERAEALARVEPPPSESPRFEADGSIEGGLVIRCGGAVLDARINAILDDRRQVESRLIALWENAP